MKEKKTVTLRKYRRSRARAVMDREGIRGKNRRGRSRSGAKPTSYFARNWKEAQKCVLKKKGPDRRRVRSAVR